MAVLFSRHVVHSRNCVPFPPFRYSSSKHTVLFAYVTPEHASAHGEPGTDWRAEAGVVKDIDNIAVSTYAPQTPKNTEDMLSLSPNERDGMFAHAVRYMKHN